MAQVEGHFGEDLRSPRGLGDAAGLRAGDGEGLVDVEVLFRRQRVKGHLFVLQTPLFRVRNKKETHYCYSEDERLKAVSRCGANAEITRFKGLGEISPDEFREFIGEGMRLDKVRITKDDPIHDLLEFYMGKNTYERQGFIIDNLRIEEDIVEQDLAIS